MMNTQKYSWEADPRAEWMPGPGAMVDGEAVAEGSDPRLVGHVRAGDLVVDQTFQRQVPEGRIAGMAGAWDWNRAEVPTVQIRADGSLVVVEGQNRVLSLQHRNPDARIWVVAAAGDVPVETEAGIALAITTNRRAHTPFERWNLEVRRGSEAHVLAEAVLARLGLRLGAYKTTSAIVAIGTVQNIVCGPGGTREPKEGAELLGDVLSILKESFDEHDAGRFDGLLMRAVRDILLRNPGTTVDFNRLKATLRQRTPDRWIAQGDTDPYQSKTKNVAIAIMGAYNSGKRQNRLSWAGTADA